MRSWLKRFFDEFLLYSSQLIAFFVAMLALIPSADALPGASFWLIAGFVVIQIGLLSVQGHDPFLRVIYSFITPAGYALVRSLNGGFILTDMGHMFLWGGALYIGLFQALTIAGRNRVINGIAEIMLAIGSIVMFVFLYFYLDLRVGLSAALGTGAITLANFRKALDVTSFPHAFVAFVASPQHAFFAFGSATFATLLLANRVRVLSLHSRIASLFGEDRLATKVPRPAPVISEEVQAVVLSADILDFTGFASRLSAASAADVLNKYYSLWGLVAEKHGGEVVGITGDSVILVFGLLGSRNAAEEAVAAASAFFEAMPGFRDELQFASLPPFTGVSVGIHAGTVIAAALGLPGKRRISVFGDAVSVATRLDSLCREFKQEVLVTQAVFSQLGIDSQSRFDRLGEVLLRNSTLPVPVYGLK
jgi:class 3 adenylate cyclase